MKLKKVNRMVDFFEYSKRDLNPHSHHWPKDFKSPPNPPLEQFCVLVYLAEILTSTSYGCLPFELLFSHLVYILVYTLHVNQCSYSLNKISLARTFLQCKITDKSIIHKQNEGVFKAPSKVI